MPNAWNLLLSLIWILPWAIIALAAGLALLRRKKSMPFLLQFLGAAGTALFIPAREIIFAVLNATRAPYNVINAAGIVLGFFAYALLLAFAVGYGWEKLAKK